MIVSRIFDNTDFGFNKITVEQPLRLNFQASDKRISLLEEQKAFINITDSQKKNEKQRLLEIEAGKNRQKAIRNLLNKLKEKTEGRLFKNRIEFLTVLKELDHTHDVKLSTPELKTILEALSERNETADICTDKNGKLEPDTDLRDTENVPLKESINKYFKHEDLSHVPDAWVDHSKTKVGYEIPLNRHFYRYEAPGQLEEIEADIKGLEKEIVALLAEAS